jgi:hypothetical protein
MNWNFCKYKNILFQRLIAADEDSNNIIKQEINILVSFQKCLYRICGTFSILASCIDMTSVTAKCHMYADSMLSPTSLWTTEWTVGSQMVSHHNPCCPSCLYYDICMAFLYLITFVLGTMNSLEWILYPYQSCHGGAESPWPTSWNDPYSLSLLPLLWCPWSLSYALPLLTLDTLTTSTIIRDGL